VGSELITKDLNWVLFFEPSAYLHTSDFNVVVLNWWLLARGPHYEVAAKNTKEAGRSLANFLDNLIQGTQEEARRELHVVGFSLGAQVAGIAAGQLQTAKLPRITGPYTVISHDRLTSLFVIRGKIFTGLFSNAIVSQRSLIPHCSVI
jgi:hypothetical protein